MAKQPVDERRNVQKRRMFLNGKLAALAAEMKALKSELPAVKQSAAITDPKVKKKNLVRRTYITGRLAEIRAERPALAAERKQLTDWLKQTRAG
jgi:hypothetical protein